MGLLVAVFDWATSPSLGDGGESSGGFFVFKIILGFICAFFIFWIVVWLNRANAFWKIKQWWHSFFSPKILPSVSQINLEKEWQSIRNRVEKGDEANVKLAVIEADKLFDDLLIKIGYIGKDMGDRLMQITPAQMPNINDIWHAHKTRNNIVHTPNFHLAHAQAREVINIFERALTELEVI